MTQAPTQQVVPLADETLTYWDEHLIPDLDVWHWDDDPLAFGLSGCLVMSREDYVKHPTFQDIRYVNAFLQWKIPSEVSHVIISGPTWITHLPSEDRSRILQKQVALGRGLIMPLSFLEGVPKSVQSFIADEHIVLCHASWDRLPESTRRMLLLHEQRRWDDIECLPVPPDIPPHIRIIANTFGHVEGSNCLGTTAYCITGEAWMREFWMFQPAFLDIITRHGYSPIAVAIPEPGDVVTFTSDEILVHAAYCLDHDRFLNKNGQSSFNPVRVVDRAGLTADWPDAITTIYRSESRENRFPEEH